MMISRIIDVFGLMGTPNNFHFLHPKSSINIVVHFRIDNNNKAIIYQIHSDILTSFVGEYIDIKLFRPFRLLYLTTLLKAS